MPLPCYHLFSLEIFMNLDQQHGTIQRSKSAPTRSTRSKSAPTRSTRSKSAPIRITRSKSDSSRSTRSKSAPSRSTRSSRKSCINGRLTPRQLLIIPGTIIPGQTQDIKFTFAEYLRGTTNTSIYENTQCNMVAKIKDIHYQATEDKTDESLETELKIYQKLYSYCNQRPTGPIEKLVICAKNIFVQLVVPLHGPLWEAEKQNNTTAADRGYPYFVMKQIPKEYDTSLNDIERIEDKKTIFQQLIVAAYIFDKVDITHGDFIWELKIMLL